MAEREVLDDLGTRHNTKAFAASLMSYVFSVGMYFNSLSKPIYFFFPKQFLIFSSDDCTIRVPC